MNVNIKCMEENKVAEKVIQVLMSTYNGEKYLKEQIDSILSQDCEEETDTKLKLLIRDDGSKDGTQKILETYAEKYPDKIQWFQGENVGVIKSFFDLILKSDEKADYYAFSDQDDYWMPDKLSVAVKKLKQMQKKAAVENISKYPLLYCCRPKLVDENLQELVSEIKRPPMRAGFGNAIVENIVTGCTLVMNHALRDMAKDNPPEFTVMHDWWFYLLASCYGEVYYDETPHICYRQHSGNVLGSNVNRLNEFRDRLKRFKGNRRNISRQLEEFVRVYNILVDDKSENTIYTQESVKAKIQLAEKLVRYRGKIRYLLKRILFMKKSGIYRQRKADNAIFRLILISGSY